MDAIIGAASERRQPLPLAHEGSQERISPELVVVVQILVPQRQAVDPLSDKVLDRVFDQVWVAVVDETGGELPDNPGPLLDLPQEQATGVRTDRPPVERSHHFPPSQGLKTKPIRVTLC
jgi:hypothetical protein